MPDPFAPTMTQCSPGLTVQETPSRMRSVPRLTVRPETARIDLLFKKVEKPRQQAGRKAPYDHGHNQIAQKALARAPTLSGE